MKYVAAGFFLVTCWLIGRLNYEARVVGAAADGWDRCIAAVKRSNFVLQECQEIMESEETTCSTTSKP